VRLSLLLLVCSALGVVGGAALIGMWCVGLAVIFESLGVAWWALTRDDGLEGARPVAQVTTLHSVLEKARLAP
jgi:hypothetical protein